ncbi:hypothetical protein RirG_002760 [Rhizophagus irregularis DAOM 197198w]|uniref:Uncharacterized protein n=1 Tax=Rhizophagus irregularis (strain DAOM 197198w) TaxID=1432141 RepID=A0A015M446_RHIIW|nr:hypothetical protein RirG_002760 [Rhizophagus irregularis DAOM 197198w]
MMAGFDEFMTKNANNTETDLKEPDDDIFVIMSCLLNRLKKNSILYWNKFSQYPPQIKLLSFTIIIILLSIYFVFDGVHLVANDRI